MDIKKNTRIGIWGYGVVGKAAVHYFCSEGYGVSVMDKRTLTSDECNTLQQQNIIFYHEKNRHQFFSIHDYLFSSPGVNIAKDYATQQHKWLHELDIFYHYFKKPIIAITGSIGKTSTMHLLESLFGLINVPICIGGNIGTPTFDLLSQQENIDYALLEVSSFQLQYCQDFTPFLAIWTNFYPNHLDHHASQEEYLRAKYNILKYQKNPQTALIDLSLREKIPPITSDQLRYYYSTDQPEANLFDSLTSNERLYFVKNNTVVCYAHNNFIPLLALDAALLSFSFLSNIIIVSAVCHILTIDQQILYAIPRVTTLPEHRLEKVATINNIDFYNDSKSTTTASTLAAVHKLSFRPLHLLLGGLSKGVDREPFIVSLRNKVKQIYCFGKEAEHLYFLCKKYDILAACFTTLDDAFNHATHNTNPNDIVLLSPAGSSYDLYKNYQERGDHFKNLVKKMT